MFYIQKTGFMEKSLIFLLELLVPLGVCAQSTTEWGIYNGSTCMNGGEMTISADADALYTLTSVLFPIDSLEVHWTAEGGIKIVSQDENKVTFRAADGESYEKNYARYAPGYIYLHVSFPRTLPEECQDCSLANYYKNSSPWRRVKVYKTFDYGGNEIIGPSCISAGDSITFSVAPWVSMIEDNHDQYNWIIPDELRESPLYYSSDKSSVTFVASGNVEWQTVKCEIGKYNFGTQTPLEASLSEEAADPIINGVASGALCVPVNSDTVTFRITNAVDGYNYIWNIRPWQIISQSESGDVITFRPTDNVKNWLYLTVSGGCKERTLQREVGRSFSTDSQIEAVGYDDCLPAGKEIRFRVSDAPQGVDVSWNVSGSGWSLNSADSINPQPYILSGAEHGLVTVESYKCASSSISRTFSIAPDVPSKISGDKCLAAGTSDVRTYSVNPVANADSYEWVYPSGWTPVGSVDGNSISLQTAANIGGLLKVRALGCDTSEWRIDTVKVQRQRIDDILFDGCLNIRTTGYAIFYLSNHSEDDFYEWNFPNSFAYRTNYLTNNHDSVRVYYRGAPGIYEVSVTPSYSCGNAGTVYKTIDMTTSATLSKSVNARKVITISLDDDTYADLSLSIEWRLNGQYGTILGQDVQSITISTRDEYHDAGTLWCKLTNNESGCITWISESWGEKDFASVNKSLTTDIDVDVVSTSGDVTVSLPDSDDTARLTVYRSDGVAVLSCDVNGSASVSLSALQKGIYIFRVSNAQGEYSFKRIWRGTK